MSVDDGTTGGGVDGPVEVRERRLTPSDVHSVLFSRSNLLHRGYDDVEVDAFLARVEQELRQLVAEKAVLRDQVQELQEEVRGGRPARENATVQAVRILSAAQQTADQYVAEAEDFSRRLALEARENYEQSLERARTEAEVVLRQAGQLAAPAQDAADDRSPGQTPDEVREEVLYLKAFGQACRTQLRSYLEALLDDVETEWGSAHPAVATAHHRANGPGPSRVVLPARDPGVTAPDGGTADEVDHGSRDQVEAVAGRR